MTDLTENKIVVLLSHPLLATKEWAKVSDRTAKRDSKPYRRTPGGPIQHSYGRVERDDLDVSSYFEPLTDGPLVRALEKSSGSFESFSATIQYLDADDVVIPSASITYANCGIKEIKSPAGDANGSDASMLELKITLGDPA